MVTLAPAALRGPSDPARRLADMWNLHGAAGQAFGRWFAVRITDGTTPDGNTLYDSRDAAISHQLHPEYCAYLQLGPFPMSADEADDFLSFWRAVYDAGHRQTDAETPVPIMPLAIPSL